MSILAAILMIPAGGRACLTVDPSGSLDFGTVQTGAVLSRTVKVENHCSGPVVVEDISVGPSDRCISIFSANFGASRAGSNSFRLEPSSSALIKVDFSPGQEGDYSCSLGFSNNATGRVSLGLHGRAVPALTLTDYNFSLVRHGDVIFECGADRCTATVGFTAVPQNVKSGFENPPDCPDEGFLQAVKGMSVEFDPCVVELHQFMQLPSAYDAAVRLDYNLVPCPHSIGPACRMNAELDPSSVHWTNPAVCQASGVIKITIDGEQNIARCRNLPMVVTTDNGTKVVQSNNSAVITTAFNPSLGNTPYRLFAEDNVVTLRVPVAVNATVTEPQGLRAYELFIKVTGADPQGKTARVEAFVRDAQNNLGDSFPQNVQVQSATWTGGVTPSAGSSLQSVRMVTVPLPDSGEKVVRLTVTATAHIKDGDKEQTVHVVWRSNELRFYSPAGCSGPTTCVERPPVLRPQGAPDRPIFTGLLNNMPDYNNYTGTAAPGALAPSLSYVDEGYWLGGAGKDGEWHNWVEDPTVGRVGYRFYTFKNAEPWDLYAMCPQSEYQLPAGNAVLPGQHADDRFFNACVDENALDCSIYRTDASKNAWDLAWTTDGWWCVKYFCSEVMKAITMDDGGAECD